MSTPAGEFTLFMEQVRDYEFRVRFDKEALSDLTVDELPPLGRGAGPDPSRLLATAMADCLCASLLFCLRKARFESGPIRAEVRMQMVRNEEKRLRVGRVEVTIDPGIPEGDMDKARRCLEIFEDFCVVTASVREGIDVSVTVRRPD